MSKLDTLYRQYRRGLLKVVKEYFDPEIAEEAVQDLFAKLAADPSVVDETRYPLAWLRQAALWEGSKIVRTRSRVKRGGGVVVVSVDEALDVAEEAIAPGGGLYVEQVCSRFGALAPSQGEALDGAARGETPTETAERLGKSAAGVRMALTAGRRRMIEALGDSRPWAFS